MILDPEVRLQFVGIDRCGLILDVAPDESMECVTPDVWNPLQADLPAPLDRAGHPSLVASVAAPLAFGLAADQGFIDLDHPKQRRAVRFAMSHRGADAVTEIPGCLVGDTDGALQLVGRNPLLAFENEINRQKPLPQRQVGIVHDRSRRHAELVAA